MPTLILKSILQNSRPSDLIILDIDSTLVNTHHRNQAIVDEFCLEMAQKYPDDVAQLRGMRCQQNDYGYYTALKRNHIQFTSDKVQQALQDFWRPRFFHSDYLHHDTAVPGAVSFVQALHTMGQPYIYLTARYKAPMFNGTLSSMANLGFPIKKELLILKEDPSEPDDEYKLREIEQLSSQFNTVTLIDNEPVVLQKLAQKLPQTQLVWFDSTHSGKATPPASAATIRDFLLEEP